MSAPRMFPPGFVGEVRHLSRHRLVPLVAHHVKLEKAGRDWKGCCPFHGEKTPSFHVYSDGHYHCFGCRAHGDAIEWLVRGAGLTFNDAVLQLAADAGIRVPDGSRRKETPAERAVREANIAHEQAEQQRIRDAAIAAELAEESDKARAIIAETVDWHGTPAWRNWHDVRGIPEAAADRSAVLRWHPGKRALVTIATDPDGTPTSGQMILLRPDGANLVRRNGKKTKLTIGRPAATRAVVRLPGDPSKPLVIAEGTENADSAAVVSGFEAWATLGPIPRIEPPADRDVIVLSDGDDLDKPAAIDLEAWVAKWRALGRRIVIARALPEWVGGKFDFNDLLRQQGRDAVLARIEIARTTLHKQRIADLAAQKLSPADPPYALPTATAAEVRAATFRAVRTFFTQRGTQPPIRMVVPGQTGSGKTEAVGQLLPHIIAADKAERELPGKEATPYRAVIAVPAHRLGRQIAERYEALGLSVAILEGRGDPWRPEKPSRPYLCRNLDAVGFALLAHQDVRSAVCGSANGKQCPFFADCGYLAQFARARDADVLVVAHEFLFERLPKSVLHDVAYVIVEEDFVPTGDAIGELPVDVLRAPSINNAPALDRSGETDEQKTADLHRYSGRLVEMFDAEPDGYLAADAPERHSIVPSDARYLRYLHWKRRRDAEMHPGMSLVERREAQHHAAINQQLPRIAALMHMLTNGEAARIRLTTDSKGRRSIVLHGRRTVAAWLADKPLLALNATARLADVQRFFPTAITADLPQARLPHQRVHQVLGSFGKGAMTDSKVADLVAEARAHVAGGKAVLVIVHEQTESAFKAIPGVRTLHHGNYAGDDDHGDVDVIMHIGGPFAPHQQIAEMATARTGLAVPIAHPVRRPCVALMEDGTGVQFERMAYEHPAAQAVHEAVYDQAFVQGGLGRGRGINRSATTPLAIFVYGNVPLPVPLASLSRWQPNRERMLLAAGGTHSNARDLYRFHGDQFDSEDAAAKWRQRNPFDEDRIRILLADDRRPHSKVTWQPVGQGQKLRRSIVPTANVAALRRAALAAFRSGLRSWQVEQLTEGQQAPLPSAALPIDSMGQCPTHLAMDTSSGRPERARQAETREHPPDG